VYLAFRGILLAALKSARQTVFQTCQRGHIVVREPGRHRFPKEEDGTDARALWGSLYQLHVFHGIARPGRHVVEIADLEAVPPSVNAQGTAYACNTLPPGGGAHHGIHR